MFFSVCASSQLLDSFAIPVVVLLSWSFLLVRYKATHLVGAGLCLLGIGCMVGTDVLFGWQQGLGQHPHTYIIAVKSISNILYVILLFYQFILVQGSWSWCDIHTHWVFWPWLFCLYLLFSVIHQGEEKLFGDLLVLGGATLYGISNVCEEFIVNNLSRVEFLGMIGLFGSFFGGIQLWVSVV